MSVMAVDARIASARCVCAECECSRCSSSVKCWRSWIYGSAAVGWPASKHRCSHSAESVELSVYLLYVLNYSECFY